MATVRGRRQYAGLLLCSCLLGCEAEPAPEVEPCDPSVLEAARGFDALGTDCGGVYWGSSVAEREAVRDCMLAAADAGEAAHARTSNGVDSISQWIIYLRPSEDPPVWGVSYASDADNEDIAEPFELVSAYPCEMIAATPDCDEDSSAFCIDCVGLGDASLWSCET